MIKNKETESNAFQVFNKQQIMELRNAYSLFGVDSDGKLSPLHFSTFLRSINFSHDEEEINAMLESISPKYDFITFLMVLEDKLFQIADYKVLINNFKVFDNEMINTISKTKLIEIAGSDIDGPAIESFIKECLIDAENIDYLKLSDKIKHGEVLKKASNK